MGDIFEVIIYKILYSIAWLVLSIVNMIREEYRVRRRKGTTKKTSIQRRV